MGLTERSEGNPFFAQAIKNDFIFGASQKAMLFFEALN